MTRRDRLLPRRGGNFPETVVHLSGLFMFHISRAPKKHPRIAPNYLSLAYMSRLAAVTARSSLRALSAPRAPSALAIYELASRAHCGPPEVAVLMICNSEDPTTTKMKKPSITGPTENPYLLFCLALMSTIPRLWMFLL